MMIKKKTTSTGEEKVLLAFNPRVRKIFLSKTQVYYYDA